MQLKRIDIAGFKSFAEKTEIEFNKGITAVVGPNGSGKSNVIEAVRWVMGEQSAKNLRGGKMPDIIFSGSELRKPVNRAEVTLIFDNEDRFLPLDYTEVSITRRVNRSGESEFYINKKTCRLKDIVDLFIDSGLGKESFSIISQGEVESILSSKPEERRLIIEEAAGVLKYKDRKKKAEQKLLETTENVSRVLDIIFELETQIEPLKRQKSIAKDYLAQKEQLRDIEIAFTAIQIDQLVKETKQMKQESNHLTNELKTAQKQMKYTKDNSVQLQEKQKKIRNEQEKIQNEQIQLVKTIEQLEGQKILLREQNKHSEEYKQSAQKKLKELSAAENQIKSDINEIKQLAKEKQTNKEKLTNRLLEAEKEVELLSEDPKKIEAELRDNYIDSMQQETSLKNEKNYIEKFVSQYIHKKNKVAEKNEHLLNKQHSKAKEISQQKEELKLAQEKAAKELLKHQEKQLELQTLRNEREKKEGQLYDALKIIQQAKAKKESLQELNDEYAGFYQGVRKVLQHKHQLKGVFGAVAELIEVQEKFTVAIDLALGTSSQQIVVKTEENAREAIKFLKQKKIGKATFLPLTTIKPRRIAQNVLDKIKSDSGFIGVASDLINYPKKMESIVLSLLGTTIIADSLLSANRLAGSLNYRYRIVSLEGDIMNAGGSMTGGANKREVKGSLLVRKKEVQTLASQIYTMDQTMQSKEVLIQSLEQQEKSLEIKLNELKEDNDALRFEQQRIKSQLSQWMSEQEQLNKEIKANQLEQISMEEEERENKIALNSVEEAIKKAQKEKKLVEERMESVFAENDKKELKKKELSEIIQHCSSTLAALKEQLAYFKKETTRLKEQYDNIIEEQQTLNMQFEQAEQSADGHQLSRQEIKEYLDKTVAKKTFTEKKLNYLKENEEEALKSATKLEQQFAESASHKQAVLEKKSKIEIEKNRIDSAMKTRLNLLNEIYSMTFETALRDFPLEMTLQEAEQKVRLLKKGIAELGSVNLSSIDEFERVNERYLFLTEQRNDLLLAKDSLQETMDEMDEEVRNRFSNMFESVQAKFNLVFTELFQGGFAELTLTDPDNLLTTGIDITAQPPGKKLQQLSLLSGGERTLTAIALLFSILLVRPVPFCILDEVEAALDEANVVRFGRYLKKFEKDTQFIVITHRKGTMEEANSLYGITMQETGVSKVVSVRLEEETN